MNKKKRILFVVFAILAVIVLLAAGYTFSKYYEAISGSASTQIASWSFKANAGDETAITDIVLKNGTDEKIAPGSNGSFQIKVDALGSDVDVKYNVNVTQEKLPSNMIFYIEGNEESKYTSLAELAETELTGTLTTDGSQTKTYTIFWDWPFNSYDPVDNSLLDNSDVADGISTASYGFKVEIIGEQVEKQ